MYMHLLYIYMHIYICMYICTYFFCTYPIAILQRGVDSLVSYHMLLKENSKRTDRKHWRPSISHDEYLIN